MSGFAERLLRWWQVDGRHDLPWQRDRSGYRVWVSEIMLQQTRVETVSDYFQRFMQRFPTLEQLAEADLDDVLALWSGLGYYARGRNLHRAARQIVDRHQGVIPADVEALSDLPGVGRSTAAAIVAQAFDRRAVILDGNVKRVLARHAGVRGWPGTGPVLADLWREAELRTPEGRAADYTQAIMDLGATLCTPRKPDCGACPVALDCVARREDRQHELPTPKPRRKLPEKSECFVIARDRDDRVLMVRRAPSGIWGGLWCLPEADRMDSDCPGLDRAAELPAPAPIRHTFTHFRLDMRFVHVRLADESADPGRLISPAINDADDWRWMSADDWARAGLPRPIRAVLGTLVSG